MVMVAAVAGRAIGNVTNAIPSILCSLPGPCFNGGMKLKCTPADFEVEEKANLHRPAGRLGYIG